jgi:hypothetical protein
MKGKLAIGLSIAISAIALALAGLHLALPSLAIDGKFITLLAIAIAPWLGTMFESLEFPGGWKVKYRDLKETAEKAKEAGLLAPAAEPTTPAYLRVAEQDPNLALAGLRIEIEKRLRKIAENKGIDAHRLSMTQLLRRLSDAQAITAPAKSVLSDMTSLLNEAAHGARVEPRAADWAMDVGPQILSALDALA